jgi:methylated-DNA-[protein]-cysteine S-methyltransferase
MFHTSFESPLGELLAVGDGRTLHGLYMQDCEKRFRPDPAWVQRAHPFAELKAQLAAYFAGRRREFDIPLSMAGSPFQRRVWEALRQIPYGETVSYGELARRIGVPSSARAVGTANRLNPVCVIVPCHRVIGADGTLTGYAGGLDRKRLLLDLEAGVLPLAPGRSLRRHAQASPKGFDIQALAA